MIYPNTPEGKVQRERDTLICYLMHIKELKTCMGIWVSVSEDVCRREWEEAFKRLIAHTNPECNQGATKT